MKSIPKLPFPFQDFLVTNVETGSPPILDEVVCVPVKRVLGRHTVFSFDSGGTLGDIFSGYAFANSNFYYGSAPRILEPQNQTGSFTAAQFSQDRIVICNDLFGLDRLYLYNEGGKWAVSNRYELLIRYVQSFTHLEFNPEAFLSSLFQNVAVFQQRISRYSDFPTIRQISLGEYLVIEIDGQVRIDKNSFESVLTARDQSYEDLLHEAKKEILSNVQAIINSNVFDKYVIDLTGGFDSRTVLSALMNFPEIKSKIQIHTTKTPNNPDLDYATSIASALALPYYTDDKRLFKFLTLSDSLDAHISYSVGEYHKLGFGTWRTDHHNHREVRFSGGCGELYRAFYMKNIVNPAALSLKTYCSAQNSGLYGLKLNMPMTILEKELDDIPGESAADKIELHYIYYRNRQHYGLRALNFATDMPIVFPLISVALFKASRQLSVYERASEKIMLDIMHRLFPLLTCFDFATKAKLDFSTMSLTDPRYTGIRVAHSPNTEEWEAIQMSNIKSRRTRQSGGTAAAFKEWKERDQILEDQAVHAYQELSELVKDTHPLPKLSEEFLTQLRSNQLFFTNFTGLVLKTHYQTQLLN